MASAGCRSALEPQPLAVLLAASTPKALPAPGCPFHEMIFFFTAMPGGTFVFSRLEPAGLLLSLSAKNRAAYRGQRPFAGYAEAARGRPQVKVDKEPTQQASANRACSIGRGARRKAKPNCLQPVSPCRESARPAQPPQGKTRRFRKGFRVRRKLFPVSATRPEPARAEPNAERLQPFAGGGSGLA